MCCKWQILCLIFVVRMESWSQQPPTTVSRSTRSPRELQMGSSLGSPPTPTTSPLALMAPGLLLDPGDVGTLRKSPAALQNLGNSSQESWLVVTSEGVNPQTSEGCKRVGKCLQGGGGEERNEEEFRKQCSGRYLIHQVVLNRSLVLWNDFFSLGGLECFQLSAWSTSVHPYGCLLLSRSWGWCPNCSGSWSCR